MKIQGIQKLTLLDYPGKMAATIFTVGCNFRCPFCYNASLVTETEEMDCMSTDEVLGFLKKRSRVLEGVCITGGEPLLQPDLEEFIREVKAMGYLVKLDTNGSNLGKLKNLVEKSLVDYVAMDIKNAPHKYDITIGMEESVLAEVKKTVDYLKSNPVPYEFRTTVVKEFHELKDMEEIGKWLEGTNKYFIQKFNDSGDLIREGLHSHDNEVLYKFLEVAKRHIPETSLRGVE